MRNPSRVNRQADKPHILLTPAQGCFPPPSSMLTNVILGENCFWRIQNSPPGCSFKATLYFSHLWRPVPSRAGLALCSDSPRHLLCSLPREDIYSDAPQPRSRWLNCLWAHLCVTKLEQDLMDQIFSWYPQQATLKCSWSQRGSSPGSSLQHFQKKPVSSLLPGDTGTKYSRTLLKIKSFIIRISYCFLTWWCLYIPPEAHTRLWLTIVLLEVNCVKRIIFHKTRLWVHC